MLKLLTFAAPLLLKSSAKRPVKSLAGHFGSYLMGAVGCTFILAALFVWLANTYNLEIAFLVTGLLLLFSAITVRYVLRTKPLSPKVSSLPDTMKEDMLAQQIPESVLNDPVVKRILLEIGDNPIAATATAVTAGMLISREL